MNKKAILLASAVALLASGTVAAGNMDYSYGQVDYVDYDVDLGGASYGVDGFGLTGSFEVTDMLFVAGEYVTLSGDGGFDYTDLKLGLGAAWAISDKADVYGVLSYLSNDVEFTDDTGYELAFGVRSMVTNQVELYGELAYVDIYEDTATAFEIGGRYALTDAFGVVLAFESGDDYDGFKLGARFQF